MISHPSCQSSLMFQHKTVFVNSVFILSKAREVTFPLPFRFVWCLILTVINANVNVITVN